MKKSRKTIPFHGIVAVGSSKDDAVNQYRLAAKGKGVSAFVDEQQSLSFVTNAHSTLSEMFNPLTGDLDLERDDHILENLSFESESSDSLEVNYLVCESKAGGCGAHVIFDSEDLVQFCPVCTSSLSEDASEEEPEEESEVEDTEESDVEESESEDEVPEDDTFEELEEPSDEDLEEIESESSDDEDSDDEEFDTDEEPEEEADGDEAEESESSDDLVVAADSFRKATRLFVNHLGIGTSLSSAGPQEAHYVVCSSEDCGVHIISENAITLCPVCAADTEEPESLEGEDTVEMDTEEEDDDNDLQVLEDEEEPEEEAEEESDSSDDEDLDDEAGDTDEEPEEEADGDEESEEESSDEFETEEEAEATDTVESNPFEEIDDTVEAANDLDVSYSSSVKGKALWTAFYKGIPVALCSREDSGNNSDIFDQPNFGVAVCAGAKHIGPVSILKEMGFKPIVRELQVSSYVARQAEATANEYKSGLDKENEVHKERLMAALATAAIGLNRKFFVGLDNPLKSSLCSALSSAGVRSPEVLIDTAFKASCDNYHKILFAKASEILSKPDEVQESLAKAVLETQYQSSSSSDMNAEDRLAALGTAVRTQPNVSESADLDIKNKITKVVSFLGKRS